jgi:hypothetical protein
VEDVEKETVRQWSLWEMASAETTVGLHAIMSPLRKLSEEEKAKPLR